MKKVTLSREHRRVEAGSGGKPVIYAKGIPFVVDDKEYARLKGLIVHEEDAPEKKPVPRMTAVVDASTLPLAAKAKE